LRLAVLRRVRAAAHVQEVSVRLSVLLSGSILAAATLTVHAARAGDQEYPLSFVERPLTLPRLTLAPSFELDIDRIGIGGLPGDVVIAGMQIGASFGITPDFEVGAIVVPIQFNNGAGYGGFFVGEEGELAEPTLFATYRFLHTEAIDLGARLAIQIVIPSDGSGAGAIIEPSVPLLVHLGKVARLDAALGFRIAAGGATGVGGSSVAVGLGIPASVAFDIIPPLHVGVSTGVFVDNFSQAGDTARIPLGVFAGYAIGDKRPIVDIDPFFSFFDFITPGVPSPGDKINPGIFIAGVSAKGYFYF
jgi:hypothetical protein